MAPECTCEGGVIARDGKFLPEAIGWLSAKSHEHNTWQGAQDSRLCTGLNWCIQASMSGPSLAHGKRGGATVARMNQPRIDLIVLLWATCR